MRLSSRNGSGSARRELAVEPRGGAAVAVSWALVALWAAFIFFMSAHTGSDLNEGDDLIAHIKQWLNAVQLRWFGPGVDLASSVAHFCEFTVLGALLAQALGRHMAGRWGMVLLVAVALASAYAVTDEVHQIFVPGRVCDLADWVVDTAGALLGAAICMLVLRARSRAGSVQLGSSS